MSIMAKTPSGYKKIGSAYLGERPVDKVFNANGDVVYALQRELTGVPPLLFKGKEQSELLNYRICGNTETKQRDYSGSSPLTVPVHDGELYNYRIYGNTVNGESVGDRTGNLFDISSVYAIGYIDDYGNIAIAQGGYDITTYNLIPIVQNSSYSIKICGKLNDNPGWRKIRVAFYDQERIFISRTLLSGVAEGQSFIAINNSHFIRLSIDSGNTNIMLNAGSTALPYEPYGYKVPIAVTNSGTTSNGTIYLPEPIKMVGSEAEYVDFYSQKQYFADGTNTAITVPALPISAGANTVTVNTTVQPSNVEVSTDENVSVGDLVTSGQHAGEYEVPVTVEGKNQVVSNVTSKTIDNGDGTFFYITANRDGSVTCNGYAKSTTFISNSYIAELEANTSYILSGCPLGGKYMSYRLDFRTPTGQAIDPIVDYGSGYTFSVDTPGIYVPTVRIAAGYTCDNLTFYPMIRKADIEDDTYEPYHAPVTTPIYLPEPIKMVGDEAEYIDYAEQKLHRVRKNLFEGVIVNGSFSSVSGDLVTAGNRIRMNGDTFIYLVPGTYTINASGVDDVVYCCYSEADVSTYARSGSQVNWLSLPCTFEVTNAFYFLFGFRFSDNSNISPSDISNIMLNSGSEPLPYEPYIENVDLDVTLPALSTIKGTNTMSVDTEVQPSRMDVKGRIKSLT